MSEPAPYLSAVVTSRNDDHGGNLLSRMQVFTSGFIEQCKRHGLAAELIVVEWNPPPDRPSLADALRWPRDFGPCRVRLIRVAPEIHQRLRHAEALPLFQMIAKNAGIRRARGRFVLATNIDILFSDELMRFLGSGALDPRRMYRIDRHDVMPDVPVDASVEEQLAYCGRHLLRVNTLEGTFRLEPEGLWQVYPQDIAEKDSGIRLGRCWYPPYVDIGNPRRSRSSSYADLGITYRWANREAEIIVLPDGSASSGLVVDFEPGPRLPLPPFRLEVLDDAGDVVADATLDRRELLHIDLPLHAGERRRFRLRGHSEDPHYAGNPQHLTFRAFACRRARGDEERQAVPQPGLRGMRALPRKPARAGERAVDTHSKPVADLVPVQLHTNGCGDFTLLSRDKWFDLRGYPEFQWFSFHLDSVFCYAAHHGGATETVLPEPMRIYHIEHAPGSGWTPEGQSKLFERLSDKNVPALDEDTVLSWALHMRRLDSPMTFNLDAWGLAGDQLPELELSGPAEPGDPPNGTRPAVRRRAGSPSAR
jgi:hypothetical protein